MKMGEKKPACNTRASSIKDISKLDDDSPKRTIVTVPCLRQPIIVSPFEGNSKASELAMTQGIAVRSRIGGH